MLAQADCFHIPLASRSVHCVVTSPPYWALRKYAGEQGQEPLGLEPTPERHIERTVAWAREVWRVLRDDGVFWLNYGDLYSNAGHGGGHSGHLNVTSAAENMPRAERLGQSQAGNLMLMPHRVALALQADDWIVRQDLVWSKPNPMPESVAGWRWRYDETEAQVIELRRGSWRHTRAHEYIFMLAKGMQYFSDQEAVRETSTGQIGSAADFARDSKEDSVPGQSHLQHRSEREHTTDNGSRNPRSVLHIPTAPYRGAHYATYPPALIAPLILATCPRWCCPVCGQGWAPVVEYSLTFESGSGKAGNPPDGKWAGNERLGTNDMRMGPTPHNNVLGHRPTCEHPHTQAEAVPGIVFDPFVGSGTSVMVARQLLRRGIGFDISRGYLDLQATLRTGIGVPSNQFDNLPLFGDAK